MSAPASMLPVLGALSLGALLLYAHRRRAAYAQRLDAEALPADALLRRFPAAGGALAAVVRYQPYAYAVSGCDDAADAARRLAAVGATLLHWHRRNPTFALAAGAAPGEIVLAFRGTETPEDAAANRRVDAASFRYRGRRGAVQRGLRDRLRAFLDPAAGGPLADPAFVGALRSAAASAPATPSPVLVVVGYSLGGAVAVGLTLLLRNPGLAEAWGADPGAVDAIRSAAGAGAGAVRCVAMAPTVGVAADPAVLDAGDIVSSFKEGDAVPLLRLANFLGPAAPSAARALRHAGRVLMIVDEAWLGRGAAELAPVGSRVERRPVGFVYRDADSGDDWFAGPAALARALPAALDGSLRLARPLHAFERWRVTVDAAAAAATAAGLPLPATPPAVYAP